jgi:hypothetical protein
MKELAKDMKKRRESINKKSKGNGVLQRRMIGLNKALEIEIKSNKHLH